LSAKIGEKVFISRISSFEKTKYPLPVAYQYQVTSHNQFFFGITKREFKSFNQTTLFQIFSL